MLMTGSLGMLASTLPVQWLLPVVGWRGLFWGVAGLLALATVLLAWAVPSDRSTSSQAASHVLGYREIFRHRYFVRLAPLGSLLMVGWWQFNRYGLGRGFPTSPGTTQPARRAACLQSICRCCSPSSAGVSSCHV